MDAKNTYRIIFLLLSILYIKGSANTPVFSKLEIHTLKKNTYRKNFCSSYDEFNNLASARYENKQFDYKLPDEVGNLYRTEGKGDRKYGTGGQLLEADGNKFKYDAEGNLITKITDKGNWDYKWYGNGMLKSVNTPDRDIINFEYDALGRRTAKITAPSPFKTNAKKQLTRWVWDGNVPLHEWTYDLNQRPELVVDEYGMLAESDPEPVENLITWVFDEGTFKPAAKITEDETYSIICDYLGTPVEMYNSKGQKTWEVEYDIYGKIRKQVKGSASDCPYRFQGQTFDEETGLYYNRFRYYDSSTGTYISQDPIGLNGDNQNFYSYVPDSNSWIDTFGLDCAKATKLAKKVQKQAQDGKFRKIPPGKVSPNGFHGRLDDDLITDILANPDAVYKSTGGSQNLTFRKGGDVVIVSGNPAAAQKGQVITAYGPSGPRGDSGAKIFGGSPSDPGLPITDSMITNGTIPKPDGGFLPKSIDLGI